MDKTTTPTIQVPTPNTKSLTIDLWAALGIVGGAILVSIVSTAFIVGRTINSDHFLTQSTAAAVDQIQTNYVRSDVYAANQTATLTTLRDIKDELTLLSAKIK